MRAKKLLSAALVSALLLGLLPAGALAAQEGQNWYDTAMTTCVERGILAGDENGNLQPNRNITRGELAVMLDRVMDYQTKAENSFRDLVEGAYYTDAILGANAAGILKGDNEGNANPSANITRQEIAVILARVMALNTETAPSGGFADQAAIANWASGAVNAMKAAGYMGAKETSFRPADSITRAEVATVLNNVFAGYYNKAETYSADANGSAVINTAGVTLKNMKVDGDLIIAEGVAEGNAYLSGVTIGGRLLVRGGGVHSIYISGSSQVGDIVIARQDGPVRVVVESGTRVGTVTIEAGDGSLSVSGTVGSVVIAESASDTKVEAASGGVITNIYVNGEGAQITGSGRVATVSAMADNVQVTTPNTKVEAAPGTSGVTAGGKTVAAGSIVTTPGTSSGGGSSVQPDNTVAYVSTLDGLKAALADETKKTINMTGDISSDKTIAISREVNINGNGKKLSFGSLANESIGERNGLLVTANGVTIKDVTIAMEPVEGWKGIYGIQVYNSSNVILHNYTGAGGDAALLVNGSTVTLTGTTNVSDNEFGGIEVAKGTAPELVNSKLTVSGAIVNTSEIADKPTIWVFDSQGTVEGAIGLTGQPQSDNNAGKTYYYVPEVKTGEELRAALEKEYLNYIVIMADISGINSTIEINHAVTIAGNGKTLSFVSLAEKPNGMRNGLLIESAGVTVNDITITLSEENSAWAGVYGIQVYDADGVTLHNYTGTGGDAALLVNGSTVTLTGTTDVSGNKFGGIEAAKGTVPELKKSVLIINGTIANTSETESEPTVWVDGTDGGTVGGSYGLKVNERVVEGKNQTFYYLPEVADADQLRTALTKDYMKYIEITEDISNIAATLKVTHAMTIDGNGHELSFVTFPQTNANGEKNGVLVYEGASGSLLKNIIVKLNNTSSERHWEGAYGIQVYNVTDVELEDCTISGGDAALLVNGSSVTLSGTTNVSGNEFGGIEVSVSTLTANGILVNTSETVAAPTIWIDGQGTVGGTNYGTIVPNGTQIYYYIKQENIPTTPNP